MDEANLNIVMSDPFSLITDSQRPMTWVTEHYKANVVFLHRHPKWMTEVSSHSPVAELFKAKNRCWELMLQMEFFEDVDVEDIFFRIECKELQRVNLLMRSSLLAVKQLSRIVGFGHWDYSYGKHDEGAWIGFPLWNCNRMVTSDSWDEAPNLSPTLSRSLPMTSKAERPKHLEGGKVYTFVHWSMYCDFVKWQLVNLPGIPAINFNSFNRSRDLYMSITNINSRDVYFNGLLVNSKYSSPEALGAQQRAMDSTNTQIKEIKKECQKMEPIQLKNFENFLRSPEYCEDQFDMRQDLKRSLKINKDIRSSILHALSQDFADDELSESQESTASPFSSYQIAEQSIYDSAPVPEFPSDVSFASNDSPTWPSFFVSLFEIYGFDSICITSCILLALFSWWSVAILIFCFTIYISDTGDEVPIAIDNGLPCQAKITRHPITVPRYRVIQGANRHIVFEISVGTSVVERRYREFEQLRRDLSTPEMPCFGSLGVVSSVSPLPPKILFGNFDPVKLERRRVGLEKWMNENRDLQPQRCIQRFICPRDQEN